MAIKSSQKITINKPSALAQNIQYYAFADIDFAAESAVNTDTVDIFAVPAGTKVTHVFAKVITAEGEASTIDIGVTGVDVDIWGAAVSLNATAETIHSVNVVGDGHFFAAAGTISALMNTAVTTNVAKIEFMAVCIDAARAFDVYRDTAEPMLDGVRQV
jgi:hypothetical protein